MKMIVFSGPGIVSYHNFKLVNFYALQVKPNYNLVSVKNNNKLLSFLAYTKL